jgi:hypothetical protein
MFGCSDPRELDDIPKIMKSNEKFKSEREYFSDDRSAGSGEDEELNGKPIDSDTEFTEIVELNTMLREFRENTFDELTVEKKVLRVFKYVLIHFAKLLLL